MKNFSDVFNSKSNTKFVCAICGKQYSIFNPRHIRSHGLDVETYLQRYPDNCHNQIIKRESKKFINHFISLYSYNNSKKLIYNKSGKISTVNKSPYFYDFEKHFNQRHILGIYPQEIYTNFFVFDIDSYTDERTAKKIAQRILEFVKKSLGTKNVYIFASGNKGYHITLYFEKKIKISNLESLFLYVLFHYKNSPIYNKNIIIEPRPEFSGNSRGIKLPLGYNFKSKKNDAFCYILDDYLHPEKDQMKAVYDIQKISNSIIYNLINDIKISKNYNEIKTINKPIKKDKTNLLTNTADSIKNKIVANDNRLFLDLTQSGARHDTTLRYAFNCYIRGISQSEAKEKLLKWSCNQIGLGYSKSSIEAIEQDIDYILKYIYSKKMRLKRKTINITKSDLDRIYRIGIKAKNSKKNVLNIQIIALAFIFQAKIFSQFNSEFIFTIDQISKLSTIKKRQSIINHIQFLKESNFLSITRKNQYETRTKSEIDELIKSNVALKKLPNLYELNFSFSGQENSIVEFENINDIDLPFTLIKLLSDNYSLNELRNMYSPYIINKFFINMI